MSAAQLPAALLEQATAPYHPLGKFAWYSARGKLGGDPVFAGLLQRGLIPAQARVLDIGCGQGLLAALLGSLDGTSAAERAWPVGWAPAPTGTQVHGIELMPRDVARAQQALAHLGARARFTQGDMCVTDFGQADAVVILDVLHYVTHAEQDAVLRRVRDALVPGGRLLLRVGDAGERRGFAISQWVDRTVTRIRGHKVAPVYGRPLADWIAQLRKLGMQVEPRPMSQGTPFANVLLVAQRQGPEPA